MASFLGLLQSPAITHGKWTVIVAGYRFSVQCFFCQLKKKNNELSCLYDSWCFIWPLLVWLIKIESYVNLLAVKKSDNLIQSPYGIHLFYGLFSFKIKNSVSRKKVKFKECKMKIQKNRSIFNHPIHWNISYKKKLVLLLIFNLSVTDKCE